MAVETNAPVAPTPSAAGAGGAESAPPQPTLELVQDEPQPTGDADGVGTDEDDEIDDSTVEFRDHPAYKKLRTSRRNLQRKLSKLSAKLEGVDLNALHHKARSYDELEALIRQNPQLRELISGRPAGKPAPAAGGAEDFDAGSFPFDPEAPGSAYLLEQAKTVHGLRRQITSLTQGLEGLRAAIMGREHHDVVNAWKTATDEAAKRLPDKPVRYGDVEMNLQQLFRDVVFGAFHTMQAKNVRITPERATQVINHYLRQLSQKPGSKQPTQAEVQRIAESAKKWPNSAALAGGGTPAPAKVQGRNIHDVGRLIRQGQLGPR